jgi:DNA-directed RNA polymerase subunit K/omega
MTVKTLEIKEVEAKAANVYEAIVVMAKRARQVNEETKLEFQQRIENLVSPALEADEDDENIANPDQMNVSLEFEKRLKPTEAAIEELMNNQLEHRYKEEEKK